MKIIKNAWNKEFKNKGLIFTEPDKNLIQIAKIFWKKGVKRILDLGCGSGRHVIFLAKKDFKVYGIDIAKYGIKLAKEWLKKEKLRANLKVGDIHKKLPYPTNFFDAIISIKVLNHGKIEQIRKCIREIERVLKPNGLIFLKVAKPLPKKKIPKEKLYGIKWIAPRTYIILGGPEKGLPHYRFNKKILLKEFKSFKVLRFWIDEENCYCLLGQLNPK
jgi:ubiquinone/menaquinone biosynthesis C-methylase UbiE